MKPKVYVALVLLALMACAPQMESRFLSHDALEGPLPVVAVLPFEVINLSEGAQLEVLASSALSHSLFLEGRCRVVDAAVIEAAIHQSRFDAQAFSPDQLREFCHRLGCDYLLLGMVESMTETLVIDPESEGDQTLQIRLRVMNGLTGQVQGVVARRFASQGCLRTRLYSELRSMAGAIRVAPRRLPSPTPSDVAEQEKAIPEDH